MSSAGARLMAAAVMVLIGATGCATEPAASSGQSSVGRASAGQSSSGRAPSSSAPLTASSGGKPGNTTSTPRPTPTSPPNPTPRTRQAVPSSPDLYPQTNGVLGPTPSRTGQLTLASSGGRTRDGKPYEPVVLTASDLWLTQTGAATAFVLEVDAGRSVGSATQARVSYDLTGDGSWDRVETFRYFATDPKAGAERYTQDAGLRSSEGKLGELRGGVVRLEVWSAIGEGGTVVDLPGSSLTLPYQ